MPLLYLSLNLYAEHTMSKGSNFFSKIEPLPSFFCDVWPKNGPPITSRRPSHNGHKQLLTFYTINFLFVGKPFLVISIGFWCKYMARILIFQTKNSYSSIRQNYRPKNIRKGLSQREVVVRSVRRCFILEYQMFDAVCITKKALRCDGASRAIWLKCERKKFSSNCDIFSPRPRCRPREAPIAAHTTRSSGRARR